MKKENTLFSPIILYIIIITLFYYDYDCTIEYECVLCVCVLFDFIFHLYIVQLYEQPQHLFSCIIFLKRSILRSIERTNKQTNNLVHILCGIVPYSSD